MLRLHPILSIFIPHIVILVFANGVMGYQRPIETGSQSTSQINSIESLPDEPEELSQDLPQQVRLLLEKHFPDYTLPLDSTPEEKADTPLPEADSYIKVRGRPLAEAVLNDEVEEVRRLLISGHPANETYYQESLLSIAARQGNAEICKLLLNAGLDVQGASRDDPSPSRTAMHWAILSGSVETAKVLLAHGAKLPQARGTDPSSKPLRIAIYSRKLEMMNFLLDQGEVVDEVFFLHDAINITPAELRRQFFERLFAAGIADKRKADTPDLFVPALATGDMALIQLLEANLPVDYTENHLRSAFQSGNIDLCRYVLSKGVRAKTNPAVGVELLRMALIDHRSRELVDLAIEAGEQKKYSVQSEACTSYCNSRDFAHPLYHAVMKNDINFCRYLIREFSSDPNLWGSLIYDPYEYESNIEFFQQGNTILFAAVFEDNADALKLLLKYTQPPGQKPIVDINAQNRVGHTVLHEAVNFGAARCVQLLLAAGADPTVVRFDGCTPLHIAKQKHFVAHSHSENPVPTMPRMFPLLAAATLSRGDKDWVNRTNAKGESILHRHAYAGHPWICKRLIELGANVNAVTQFGHTPLNLALLGLPEFYDEACKERYIATCVALIEQGTDIAQAKTPHDQHYLRQAAAQGLYEVHDLLLSRNAQPNLVKNAGSLLCSAAMFNKSDRIKQLLDWGADINAREDVEFSTALHQAARFHHLEVCELLIAQGADVNARGIHGQTPLFELFDTWASHAPHAQDKGTQEKAFAVLQLLLKHGADPKVKTNRTTNTLFNGTVLEVYRHMPQSFRDALR